MGLPVWLAAEAPICPSGWTSDAEQWVCDHVFGGHCLGSFRELLEKSIADNGRDKIKWDKHVFTGRFTSYWAVSGRNTLNSPIRIYEQIRAPCDFATALQSVAASKAHDRDHRSRIARIVR